MGVNTFLLGLIGDLDQRCARLLALLEQQPRHVDIADFHLDVTRQLRGMRSDIAELRPSDLLSDEGLWPYALSDYQDLAHQVTLVEQFAIPLLLRYDDRDHRCFELVATLVCETNYPRDFMPRVTATSEQYYWAQPAFRIIGVPAGDLDGILGWPDLLHELAHLLLTLWPDLLAGFTAAVNAYFRDERNLLADIGGSDRDSQWLAIAQIKWGEQQEGTWRVELACDLIATYLGGSSYGWQHTRLAANLGNDPYHPSPGQRVADHPADQARLDAIVTMLRILGLSGEATAIARQWEELRDIGWPQQPPQGYDLYYPPQLLQELARTVFTNCARNGLVACTSQITAGIGIVALINQAWHEFHHDPIGYPTWEQQVIARWYAQRQLPSIRQKRAM